MKVIFLEDIPGTADAGEVKDVKNGFARNYLLPKSLAVLATANQMQRLKAIEKAGVEKRVRVSEDMQKVAEALEGTVVTMSVRVGPTGRLFGAVTNRHIADELLKQTGRKVDHRNLLMAEAIHEPGTHDVNVRLYRNITANIKVAVKGEGFQSAIPAPAAQPPPAEATPPETPAAK